MGAPLFTSSPLLKTVTVASVLPPPTPPTPTQPQSLLLYVGKGSPSPHCCMEKLIHRFTEAICIILDSSEERSLFFFVVSPPPALSTGVILYTCIHPLLPHGCV
ncbi:hypothetical protein AMECASPLE_001097 [Ameca splendens]|uniref:Uncharacterized protein n=1 Tax=Ameca splendens TaxID=208324 RepID=A0ABV0Y956_9TELE